METMQAAVEHYQNGEYEKAIPLAETAAGEIRSMMGEENVFYKALLTIQAGSHSKLYNYLKAEAIWLKLKKLGEKDKSDGGYAACLNNLANLYSEMGLYQKAEPLLVESMELTRKYTNDRDSTLSYNINNLAALYHSMGQYAKAEPLYIQAMEIRRKVVGANHPSYAVSINNLGTLYLEMGQAQKAEPLFLEAKEIRKRTTGEMDADYAMTLNNLAALYEDKKDYAKAEAHYLQAQEIWKQKDQQNPDYAMNLNNLASLYVKMKQTQKAEAPMKKASEIWRTIYGEKHPLYALSLNNLGALYRRSRSRLNESKQMYERSLLLRKEVLGKDHPLTADTENDLGLLYMQLGEYAKAETHLVSASRTIMENLVSNFSVLSDKEKARYLEFNYLSLESNNSFIHNHRDVSKAFLRNSFDLHLLFKSLSLADTRNMLNRVKNSNDSSLRRLFEEWKTKKLILSHQYSLPAGNRMSDLATLESSAEAIEKELNRRSIAFRDQKEMLRVNTAQVQARLANDEAAIEFVRFRLYRDQWDESAMYGAYVLRKNDEAPVFVPLCTETDLDRVILKGGSSPTNVAKVFYRSLIRSDRSSLADSLYEITWKPLEKYLSGVKRVSYSPAGKLYGIAFHALPSDSNTFLVDKYLLQQFTSIRNIALRSAEVKATRIGNLVLFGDATFSMDSSQLVKRRSISVVSSSMPVKGLVDTKEAGPWTNLPGTAEEVRQIESIFKGKAMPVRAYTGIEASEENVKALDGRSPGTLHIATHGFFLPEGSRTSGTTDSYSAARDPLLRSGLVFAGGNYSWTGGRSIAGVEDGIATAYELAQLDLGNTELVVLSACETGLGDVKGAEGVFGLQRSFKMAGVKNMIVSLWQVPDKETIELMTAFYSNRLGGKSTRESFNLAQGEMRRKYPPFYWAAFVLVE